MATVANILNPIQPGLSPRIWNNPDADEPTLKPHIADFIKHTIYHALETAGYVRPKQWLHLVLTGSLTTFQYDDDSDCDISLFVDSQILPEWSRAEMIGVMVDHCDDIKVPGSPFVLQDYVVPAHLKPADLYRPGLRSGWDIDQQRWITPPERARTHDVQAQENGFYVYALEQADKMERLLRYEPEKAKTFWHQIHARRREDMAKGKGDFAESNIVYKFLANRGLFPALAEATGEHIAKTAGLPHQPVPDDGFGYAPSPEEPFSDTVRSWYDPAKIKPYAEHPPEVQQALQRYWEDMAIDDGEWDGEDEEERPLVSPQEPFGYTHVPMQSMTQALHQRMRDVDGYTAPSWDAYHQEYVGQGDTPNHGTSRWPVITSPSLVVDDGFHRLHDYYRQGDQSVPVVWSPPAEATGEYLASATEPAKTAGGPWQIQMHHNLQWKPGGPGKGFILQDGSVWSWPTEHMKPIHAQMNGRAKAQGLVVKPLTAFHIEPTGRIWHYNPPGSIPSTSRQFDPDDRFNIMKAGGGLWLGDPDATPPQVQDDGYGHAMNIMSDVDTQTVLNANAGQNLQGLPGPVNVGGYGPLQFQSHGGIQQLANEYNASNGLGAHPTDYVKVNPTNAQRIAQEYEAMPHDPQNPEVQAAYGALANEVRAQYDHAVNNGYRFEFYPDYDPYPNSPREAVLDLHQNKHMYVYPTEAGYGQEGEDPQDHPLLGDSGVRWNGQPVTHNDLFRAIHDFYGHAKEGLGFRADGEDNAFRQHQAMFSPQAQRALTSETRGQNSWVNYGPHGAHNQTATSDTIFAPQKAGLMPEWTSDPDLHLNQAQPTARSGKLGAMDIGTQAAENIRQHGGITISLDGQVPSQGFAFSAQLANEEKVPLAALTPEVVNDYIDRHRPALSEPGRYFGGWIDKDLVYLDVSQVDPDEQTAYTMAQQAHQLAMFNLDTMTEIPISPQQSSAPVSASVWNF